jgi:hypothetical protein
MRMKDFLLGLEDDLRSRGNYCCYCIQPQDGKISCCQENHFVPFDDLYEEDKESLIQGEVGEYEAWSKTQ